MAGQTPKLDPAAYREFLQRKRQEVEQWPEWKKQAAEAAFAPKLVGGEPRSASAEVGELTSRHS